MKHKWSVLMAASALVLPVVLIAASQFLQQPAEAADPAQPVNEMEFSIPANSFCTNLQPVDHSLNVTNRSAINATITLYLFKEDGTPFEQAGTSYDGIKSTITPGVDELLNGKQSAFYHLAFGGQGTSCDSRPYSGKLVIRTGSDVTIVGSGFIADSQGKTPIPFNGGQPWKVPASTITPLYSENVIPALNGTESPSLASASNIYDSRYQAWKAFNHTTNDSLDAWGTSLYVTTGWIQYDFGEGNEKAIAKYTLRSRNDTSNFGQYNPKSWQFLGSNDGVTFVTLDTVTNQPNWGNNEKREFTFTNTTCYRYYRLNVTASTSTQYTGTGELEMMERIN